MEANNSIIDHSSCSRRTDRTTRIYGHGYSETSSKIHAWEPIRACNSHQILYASASNIDRHRKRNESSEHLRRPLDHTILHTKLRAN